MAGQSSNRKPFLVIVPDGCPESVAGAVETTTWSSVLRGPEGQFTGRGLIACLPCRFRHGPRMRDLSEIVGELHAWTRESGTFVFLRPPSQVKPMDGSQEPVVEASAERDRTESLVFAFGDETLPHPSTSAINPHPMRPYAGLTEDLQEALAEWVSDCPADFGVPLFSPSERLLPLVVFEGDHRIAADVVLAAHAQPLGDGLVVLLPSPSDCLAPGKADALRRLLQRVRLEAGPDTDRRPRRGAPRSPSSAHKRVCDFLVEDGGGFSVPDLKGIEELQDIGGMRQAANKAVKLYPDLIEKDHDGGQVIYRAIRR